MKNGQNIQNNNKAYYIYDANGNRVRKVIVKANIIEERFYVGDYEIFTKTNNGTVETERETLHITDDKNKVALIDYDTQTSTTTVRYQYTNHLDSASLELDQNGDIITYEEYHPFGTTSYRSGRNEIDVSLKRYKYVHKELDNETGLYYYGMRYYAPWIARFISVDPLQFDYPYYTPYQYAGNKPISYIDLDGAEESKTKENKSKKKKPEKKEPYKRIIVYGGAKSKTDNSSFYFAALNVKKDYNNDGKIIVKTIDSAKNLIDFINSQEDNSIQSLDIFTHGDMFGIYLIKGASINKDITTEEVEKKDLNASLYIGSTTKFFYGSDLHDESDTIKNIDFKKFTENAKIEIHGCLTAGDAYIMDNIAADLSEYLYSAGKVNSVVIGHITKANPLINGEPVRDENGNIISGTTIKQQDYRHGKRVVYNNGEIILKTNKIGRITAKEINNALINK